MQKINEQVVFSASDLVHFMECEHLSALDRLHLDEPMEKAKDSEEAEFIQNRGYAHEKAYLEKAKASAENYIDIAQVSDSREAQVAATEAAMKEGVDLIYQAAFFQLPMIGYADFLKKVNKPSNLGKHSYEIVDTKLSKTSRAKFIIQLAFYADLLEGVQGIAPEFVSVVLGDGSEEKFQFSDYRYYYLSLKQRFLDFLAASDKQGSAQLAASSIPFPCDKCDLCHWRDRCNSWWDETDHLTQVANILKTHIRKLNAAGVSTVEQLANLPMTTRIPKIPDPVLQRLRHQATLQHKAKITGERWVERIEVDPEQSAELGPRGFGRLPKPSPHDLFFDMEGFPHVEDGLEYLFGLYFINESSDGVFKPFWGHDRAGEKRAFEAWVDFVMEHLDQYPEAHIYHYAAYEKTALRKLMRLHGTREKEVDHLLRANKLVDLYQVVRESIRISERSYSIKYVEKFYRSGRSAEVKSAGSSIVAYQKWRDSDPKDQNILNDIEKYNEEDVISTYELLQWLHKQRPEQVSWYGEHLQEDAPELTGGRSEKTLKFEERLALLHDQLSSHIPDDASKLNTVQAHAAMVRDLLDFHRRSTKPQWWAVFDRQAKSFEERIEDVECIAAACPVPDSPPVPEKQSFRYTYQYPPQEVKLKTTDNVVLVDSLMGLTDFTVDLEQRIVTFKLGKKRTLPPGPIDIGTGTPIDQSVLQNALFRYAESLISALTATAGCRYPAIDALLRREFPAVAGIQPGSPLLPDNPDIRDIFSVISRMDQSVIFIQGPPGAGKTYTASKVILDLLEAGKRIGVSSNSHKAIVNLLQAVEKEAKASGFTFVGVKKSDPLDESQCVNGEFITDIKDKEAIIAANAQLVAGTAWLFSTQEFDQQFDYLFVDEAGQVALGMLIPMATSTKNIVLLGDQMQLSQPVEGVHPGRSGDSVLDYLLQGESTISPDRGIFLEKTWRMHPEVCQFISEAIYNGRLHSHPTTAKRLILCNEKADPALKPCGIVVESVNHEACSQDSDEEATRVKAIYDSLLEQSYVDDKGVQCQITPHNILVVSPYNMQVNLLKQYLGPDARVGTVDKFQGQEAEAVIISMATSSGEDLPRNIDFLFSKNRLNVAISRAKCLAIVVASPKLLSVSCRTPEQIALVNTLCWVHHDYRRLA
jgi:predicted RecB family nuclease